MVDMAMLQEAHSLIVVVFIRPMVEFKVSILKKYRFFFSFLFKLYNIIRLETRNKSSVESQKGIITIQQCSIENQKGTIAAAVQRLWQ